MRPSETTATWSAWAMVVRRWAMMMVVRPERSRWRASVMRASEAASRLLVASSRMSRAGSASQARAKATSWRSPAERRRRARRLRCRSLGGGPGSLARRRWRGRRPRPLLVWPRGGRSGCCRPPWPFHVQSLRTGSCAGGPSAAVWSWSSGWRWPTPPSSGAGSSAAPGSVTAGMADPAADRDHLLAQGPKLRRPAELHGPLSSQGELAGAGGRVTRMLTVRFPYLQHIQHMAACRGDLTAQPQRRGGMTVGIGSPKPPEASAGAQVAETAGAAAEQGEAHADPEHRDSPWLAGPGHHRPRRQPDR